MVKNIKELQQQDKSRRDQRSQENRKAKGRASGDRYRRNRDRDAKSKERAITSRSDGSDPHVSPGAVNVKGAYNVRNIPWKGSSKDKGSSRTKDRDAKPKLRPSGQHQAKPGAVAENTREAVDLSASERSRRHKEKVSRSSGARRGGKGSRRERNRKRKEEGASSPYPQSQTGTGETAPMASAIETNALFGPESPFEATSGAREIIAGQTCAADQAGREEVANKSATSWLKCKLIIALMFLLLIAGGTTAWFFLSRKSNSSPQDLPIRKEDCVTISKQQPVQGQDVMTSKIVALEINLVLLADVNAAKLQADLAIGLQNNVFPALAGCDTEFSISFSVGNFAIANAMLNAIIASGAEKCKMDSEQVCSAVYMELNLFLKEDDATMESLRELVVNVFQDDGLLEVLNLQSWVEAINVDRVYEISPSTTFPSVSPSKQGDNSTPDDTGPDPDACLLIGNGTAPVDEDMSLQQHDILFDVMLDSEAADLPSVTIELEEKIQRMLMPALAGCSNQGRRLQSGDLILNAVVNAEHVTDDEVCLSESDVPCYRYVIHLDIYVKKIASTGNFTEYILAIFREAPLVNRLGLVSPFVRITVVGLGSPTDLLSAYPTTAPATYITTKAPSRSPTIVPSVSPTRAPVAYPTTEGPTSEPSLFMSQSPTDRQLTGVPTKKPSMTPTGIPSTAPSPAPSTMPFPGTTPVPTSSLSIEPSKAPSKEPSRAPSSSPSSSPSTRPSSIPSIEPSKVPSRSPSSAPSWLPSVERKCFDSNEELTSTVADWFNTTMKASVESQYGLIGAWCFGPGVTSMQGLFSRRTTFNEDISNWDVSFVTNMRAMFHSTAFNQPIGNWNVSSVTNMNVMFWRAMYFNQDLGNWDVSSVTNFESMFYDAFRFNQDISGWNVSSVTGKGMRDMFAAAQAFNQSLCAWGPQISAHTSQYGLLFYGTSCPFGNVRRTPENLLVGPFCHACT